MNDELETTADPVAQGLPKPHIPTPTAPSHQGTTVEDSARVALHSNSGSEAVSTAVGVPLATRIIAGVIDAVLASVVMVTLAMILPFFAGMIGFLAYAGYMICRDSLPFLGGQSVGKKIMKIRAVTLDGQSLAGKWEVSLLRSGVLLIPAFGIVEIIILATREGKPEQGRRLGDEWAKTKVIAEPGA
jgi:uncharacterized RDD family membrane protein YckC